MKATKYFLALWLCLLAGLSASAFNINFSWNIAGAVEIKTDSYMSGPVVGPASDSETSFSYDCPDSMWVYVVAKEGYKIVDASINGKPAKPSLYDGKIYVGQFMSGAGSFNVTLAEIDRTSEIRVDVVNGADYIKATFNDGYSVTLQNGVNHVMYDPVLETSLTLQPYSGPKDFFSITLNGEPMKNLNQWNSMYEVKPLVDGDKVTVRVFEGEEPPVAEYTVSFKSNPGMEDCIVSIYNSSTSTFFESSELPLSVRSGNTLRFNFNTEDYDYYRFLLNGRNVTSDFIGGSLVVTVDSDIELYVEGQPKTFPEVDYTVYVMNPEGVKFYLGGYQKNPYLPADGEAIQEPIMLEATGISEAVEMTPEDTERFTLTVGGKTPNVFISPVEGWYIYTVQGDMDGESMELNYVTTETPIFYVVARKFDNLRSLKVDVAGDAHIAMSGASMRSSLWDNPGIDYSLEEGVQTVEFLPGYNLPLSVRSIGEVENMSVFLDGAALSADENMVYSFTPWYPEAGEEQTVESTLTVVCDGKPARTSRVRLELEDDMEAVVYYSAVRHELAKAGQFLLSGTEVIVKPAMEDCTIKLNGEVVYGLGADEKFVGSLNESGEYVFDAPTGTATVTVSKGCGFTSVDMIDAADSLDTVPEIWTIDGRRVAPSPSLAPGLYIISGRKILVK